MVERCLETWVKARSSKIRETQDRDPTNWSSLCGKGFRQLGSQRRQLSAYRLSCWPTPRTASGSSYRLRQSRPNSVKRWSRDQVKETLLQASMKKLQHRLLGPIMLILMPTYNTILYLWSNTTNWDLYRSRPYLRGQETHVHNDVFYCQNGRKKGATDEVDEKHINDRCMGQWNVKAITFNPLHAPSF
jgi:hypothetical protein